MERKHIADLNLNPLHLVILLGDQRIAQKRKEINNWYLKFNTRVYKQK